MEHNPHNLKERLLQKIAAREISMRPRTYFTAQVAALSFVALCVLLLSIFIFNFLFFVVRLNGHDALLGFGARGFAEFVRFFPWELLLIDALLIFALQWMLRAFRLGCQTPVLYLVGGLLAASAVLGAAIDRTPLNDRLLDESDKHHLGAFGDLYGHARRPPPLNEGVCLCTITAIAGNMLIVQDDRATTTLTIILPENDARATTTDLKVGDTILIAGDRDGSTITAFGVRKAPPNGRLPGHH